jgi:quercetin dioxygenase-like cupin family protein
LHCPKALAHHNEQITYILVGELSSGSPKTKAKSCTSRRGEVLHIPSHVPHKAEAVEDTFDVDIFDPPR